MTIEASAMLDSSMMMIQEDNLKELIEVFKKKAAAVVLIDKRLFVLLENYYFTYGVHLATTCCWSPHSD